MPVGVFDPAPARQVVAVLEAEHRHPVHSLDLRIQVVNKLPSLSQQAGAEQAKRQHMNAGHHEDVAQLRQAQDLVLRGDEQALPHWAALWGSARACVNSHTAKTLNRIGDHASAERYYAAAARARPHPDQQRITGLELAAQGGEQAAQGHVDQACATWGRALIVLDGVRSARAAKAVSGMRRSVRPWLRRGARTAADLDERARCWLARLGAW